MAKRGDKKGEIHILKNNSPLLCLLNDFVSFYFLQNMYFFWSTIQNLMFNNSSQDVQHFMYTFKLRKNDINIDNMA
jgi:hypothetical protein